MTKANNGKNGKKASIKGSNIPGTGPKFPYLSNSSLAKSKNSFASCMTVIVLISTFYLLKWDKKKESLIFHVIIIIL